MAGWLDKYQEGGIIPKAQEGKKVKKSVIFAESPTIAEGQSQYNILDYDSQLPPSLNNIREKYKDLRKRADELYSTTVSHRNYLINYLKGYTGKDVYSVNSDNTYYARDDDGYGITYSTEEFKDLPPLKKYNELQKELDENYYPSLVALEDEFRDHPDNPVVGDKMVDSTFQVEGNKLKSWYKGRGEELDVVPIYGLQDTSEVNAALKDIDLQDVGIMGHSGRNMGGIPLEWWNDKLKNTEYRNCVLGTCSGDNLLPLLPDVKNIYHTIKNRWYGVNPSADSLENALFSTQEETKIKPIKGRDYNISNKYKTGGNVSYTPEYIEQLKQFENRPDNLAYHLDNKKIPTIGWGHKITEEELKRKAIKMGKEWVPYERFSGKEGRILADKLMEQDVSHHYARLERQVGKDTLNTLPPEVQDVLLDITYNRGSLGDSLEYVKKGDIPGLKDYLASIANNRRTKWRADRIPVKTLPPVERPIEYNTKDQYVPEVLRSIAEQPSTQSIIPIQDNEGYRNQENYGKPVQITSNQSTTPISMQDVPFPILAMSDTGELKIMMPGEEHTFEGGSVTELPMAQEGVRIKSDDGIIYQRDDSGLKRKLNYLQGRWQDSPYPEILSKLYDNTLGVADYDKPYVGGVAPLPASNIKFDPKSFGVNRIFEPFTLIKSTHPNRFITKPSFNYRLTGQGQIDDMIEQGYVVAKRGKISGGRSNETHWSKGGADYSPQEGKYLLESNKVVHEQVGGIPLSDVNIYKSVGQKWEPYKLGSSTHEQGGNIKKSNQLRTFTGDSRWLDKWSNYYVESY